MANRKVTIVLAVDDKASKVLKKFGGVLKKNIVAAAAAAGLSLAGLAAAIFKVTKEAELAARVDARLEASMQNVEGAASDAADQIRRFAFELRKKTAVDDDAIKSAAAMLGTFQLTERQIIDILPRLLDMAAATEKASGAQADLEQIAIALGKAFTGQVGLLARYGVVLDDATAESGDFNKILQDLDLNFKGTAEALGKDFPGSARRAILSFGDLAEAAGRLFTESEDVKQALQDIALLLGRGVKFIEDNREAIQRWVGRVIDAGRALAEFVGKNKGLIKGVGEQVVVFAAATTAAISLNKIYLKLIQTKLILNTVKFAEAIKLLTVDINTSIPALVEYGRQQGFLNAKFAGATPLIKSVTRSLGGFGKVLAITVLAAAAAVAVKLAFMTRELNKLQEAARQKEIESFSKELQGIRGSADDYIEAGGSLIKATERIRAALQSAGATVRGDFGEKFEAALAIETIQAKFGDDAQKIINAAKRMSEDGVLSFDRLNTAVRLFEERQDNLAPVTEKTIENTNAAIDTNEALALSLELLGAIVPAIPGPSKEDIEQTRKALEAQKDAIQEIQQLNFEASASKREILERELEDQLEHFEKMLEFEGINTEERLALKEFEAQRRKEIDAEVDEHSRQLALENLNFGQELALESVETLTEGLATFVEHAILNAENLKEVGEGVIKSLVGSVVGGLAKMASQFLVNAILHRIAKKQEGASALSANLAAVFSGAFASTAAIPIVGPTLAPAVAAASLAAATAGSTAAAAAGAGLGAGIVAQEGGFVPMLPGASPGRDSVLAALTPGELITPEPFVNEVLRAQRFQDGGVVGGEAGAPLAGGGILNATFIVPMRETAEMLMEEMTDVVVRHGGRLAASEVTA